MRHRQKVAGERQPKNEDRDGISGVSGRGFGEGSAVFTAAASAVTKKLGDERTVAVANDRVALILIVSGLCSCVQSLPLSVPCLRPANFTLQ